MFLSSYIRPLYSTSLERKDDLIPPKFKSSPDPVIYTEEWLPEDFFGIMG